MVNLSRLDSLEPFQPRQETRWREVEREQRLKFKITDDRDEAIEIVADLLGQGEPIIITVPEEHVAYIREHGIPQIPQVDRSGRGKHYSVLAGRLGSDPYFNIDEERWVIEVDPEGLDIQPRMTGGDHAFYGTITVGGRIPAEKINVVGKFSRESWEKHRQALQEAQRRGVAA